MQSHIDRTLRRISESCCADEQLEQYARGTLKPMHSAWVAMHLDACELCRARILLSEESSARARLGERLRTAWLDVVDTISLGLGDTGFQLRTGGLKPIFAEPTLFDGVKILAGVLELQLGEHKTLELRVERASTSSVLVKLTALQPLSAMVEVRDANGVRHARQRLDDVAEFELGPQVWTLYLRLQDDGAELTIPIHVSNVASP